MGAHVKAHENFQDKPRRTDICSLCLKKCLAKQILSAVKEYFMEREKVDAKSWQIYKSKQDKGMVW